MINLESNKTQCDFFEIFELTSNTDEYKSRVNLKIEDTYYPKRTIFKYDYKLFDCFLCFYENKSFTLEIIEQNGLNFIYTIKQGDSTGSHFINQEKEKTLYRFGELKWLKKAYFKGNFLIKPSIHYLKNEYNNAQQDNEHLIQKPLLSPTINGIPVTGDINYFDLNINNYILCMSYEFDQKLFEAFKPQDEEILLSDMACLVITDPIEFERRLKLVNEMKHYIMMNLRVRYNDNIHPLGPIFNKNREFKIQKEFRFTWINPSKPIRCSEDDILNRNQQLLNKLPKESYNINIGSLEDISFIINSKGNRISF